MSDPRRLSPHRGPSRNPHRPTGPALVAGLLAVTAAACTAPPYRAPAAHRAGPPSPAVVEVSPGDCGRGWSRPRPGTQEFALRNTTAGAADVRLQDARTGAVYGEAEGIGPGAVRLLRVRLGAGGYAFVCLPEDADAVTGPTVHIPGTAAPGPAAVPVTRGDLIPPTLDYQRWTGRRLTALVAATDALRAAVDDDDRALARRRWLTAHLDYQRLGGAYGAFGEAAEAIDRTSAGLPGGVHDRGFTGFHRLEYGLWHNEEPSGLRRAARRLATDVRALRDAWDHTRMDPADLVRRAHEILEDTMRFELTGRTDYGSGTTLATARAQLDGTGEVLARLRPLLRTRYRELDALDRQLDHTRRALDDARAPLGRARHEQLDADFGDLVERLAAVAALCTVRRAA